MKRNRAYLISFIEWGGGNSETYGKHWISTCKLWKLAIKPRG